MENNQASVYEKEIKNNIDIIVQELAKGKDIVIKATDKGIKVQSSHVKTLSR